LENDPLAQGDALQNRIPLPNSGEKPLRSRLILTHILQTDCMKEPGKTIASVEIDITSALVIPLSSDSPKMWVKDRRSRMGMKAAPPAGGKSLHLHDRFSAGQKEEGNSSLVPATVNMNSIGLLVTLLIRANRQNQRCSWAGVILLLDSWESSRSWPHC
jgi:hypothetical protein